MAIASISGVFGDWVWPLLEFLIGVGLVILVHELGHFLAAKAVNIKVKKFAMAETSLLPLDARGSGTIDRTKVWHLSFSVDDRAVPGSMGIYAAKAGASSL